MIHLLLILLWIYGRSAETKTLPASQRRIRRKIARVHKNQLN